MRVTGDVDEGDIYIYSWSSSDDCSKESSAITAGAALDDLSGTAVDVLWWDC